MVRDPEQIGALPVSVLHGRPSKSGDSSRYAQIRRIRVMTPEQRIRLALRLGALGKQLRSLPRS